MVALHDLQFEINQINLVSPIPSLGANPSVDHLPETSHCNSSLFKGHAFKDNLFLIVNFL